MSGDMFSTMSNENTKKVKFMRVDILDDLPKCSFIGDCKWRYSLTNKETLCNMCEHKIFYDIPTLLNDKLASKE